MYKTKNLKKSFEDDNSEDDFDFCNTETGQKFAIKWSPSEDIKLISKHRYNGTRSLGRSVPRRKRGLFQYKINRSLNFEIGSPRHEAVFKSSNFDSDDSPICNEKYLTRSAKILRSLNINFSPSNSRNKKINKMLNFNLSPSPKRILSSSESLSNTESPNFESNINRNSKINKTLNFSSSSNGSNFSTYLESSVESIDENQNQTPSHRNSSVKKSLNYLTPSPKPNANILRSINKTPMSREEFFNKLKHNAETPDSRIVKQSEKKPKHFDGINISTPRNLFQDFEEDDKNTRPITPENVIQFVPESMSAIKKSHKKERQSNRSEKLYANELKEYCSQTENSSEDPLILSQEERPATPITNDNYPSPNYSMGSIKQSHKKDKSKIKTALVHSEDEISDSGSIFDYTGLMEKQKDSRNQILNHPSPLSSDSSGLGLTPFNEDNVKRSMCLDNSVEELSDNGSIFDYSETVEMKRNPKLEDLASGIDSHDQLSHGYNVEERESFKLSFHKLELISPVKTERVEEPHSPNVSGNEGRPVTPENVINVLDQVISDSIKKSHKKIKDKNKKILIKPLICVQEPTEELPTFINSKEENQGFTLACDLHTPENVARAGTPENVNSSRMLLGQYSSVKKSHKKNKHKKIVTESAKRQRYFHGDDQRQTSDDASHVSGVKTLLSPSNNLETNQSKRRKSIRNESLVIAPVIGIEICSTTPDKISTNDPAVEFSSADTSPLERSTPNKRKKSSSFNETEASTSSVDSPNVESSSMDYESAEEEFKIFTPIKKRRPLRTANDNELIQATSLELKTSQSSESTDQNCTTQEGSFKSIENSFATPPQRNRNLIAVRENNMESIAGGEACDNGNSNGRSTPQNRSTAEMIFDINSIKKSHKKDKRNSRLRRTLNVEDRKDDFQVMKDQEIIEDQKLPGSYQPVTPNNSISDNDFENPKPSTSFGETCSDLKTNKTTNSEATKTPPNCLKVINFMKLRQADSIKRSHKKIREQKRQSAIINDPELSDDGSIFDSSERIASNEFDHSIDDIEGRDCCTGSNSDTVARNGNVQATPQPLPQTPPNTLKLIQIESIKKSHKKVREYKRKGEHRDVSADLSEDGSIFDPDERLDESISDLEEVEDSTETSP